MYLYLHGYLFPFFLFWSISVFINNAIVETTLVINLVSTHEYKPILGWVLYYMYYDNICAN